MADTLSYYFVIAPEQEAALELVFQAAQQVLALNRDAWGQPEQDQEGQWVMRQGEASLRFAEPHEAHGTRHSGWVELAGFPAGGRARWQLGEPPRLDCVDLSAAAQDQLWALMRAAQAEALRLWMRSKSPVRPPAPSERSGGWRDFLRVLSPQASDPVFAPLPRVAQPLFAPDDFPTWLVRGELSSLGRYVAEARVVIAGVALEAVPEQRLLIRPVHRMGAQAIVPVALMRRGHAFSGGAPLRTPYRSVEEIWGALRGALDAFMGGEFPLLRSPRRRDTEAAVVYFSRWQNLEHSALMPFEETAAVAKVLRTEVSVRAVEVRSRLAASGAEDGLVELSVDGLREGTQLFIAGKRVNGVYAGLRVWALGPAAVGAEVVGLTQRALEKPA